MFCEDLVNLVDDEAVTETTLRDIKKRNHKEPSVIATIDLDVEFSQCTKNNNVVIINDDEHTKPFNNLHIAMSKDNKLLGSFIEKCLNLENSKGMARVINNTLIKNYMETNKSYKNSRECMRSIRKAICQLECDPAHKFSHVKNLCDTFKLKRFKKRVKLTTLATNLTEKPKNNAFGKPKTIIIDSDDEQTDVAVINLDDDPNDVIVLDEPVAIDDEKENKSNVDNTFLVPEVEVSWDSNISTAGTSGKTEQKIPDGPTTDILRIKKIEKQIESYRNMIIKLEEQEVDEDSMESPYIKCEKVKSRIVSLYSELCDLTGHQAVKRREVRLQVLEGHPAGPVRKLEQFINDNIGSDGDPPFPDFYDVVNCVTASNVDDNLGWSKHQIMKEASALFTQCGSALQKRRQKREWRDLMEIVKTEAPDTDPAENDPELLAKLKENKKIAVKKENDLLERFSMMQDLPKPPSSEPSSRAESSNNAEYNESEMDIEINNEVEKVPDSETDESKVLKSPVLTEGNTHTCSLETNKPNNSSLTKEPKRVLGINKSKGLIASNEPKSPDLVESNAPTGSLKTNKPESSLVNNELKIVLEINESKDSIASNDPKSPDLVERNGPTGSLETKKHKGTLVTNETKGRSEPRSALGMNEPTGLLETSEPTSVLGMNEPTRLLETHETDTNKVPIRNEEENVVKVKIEKEPIDIVNQLELLGENFTITIADIEDPFLVIEISSDSSDDEDEN